MADFVVILQSRIFAAPLLLTLGETVGLRRPNAHVFLVLLLLSNCRHVLGCFKRCR